MTTQEIKLFYETNNYKIGDTEITILGECNIIPNYCFHRHTELKKVTIEEGVEVILGPVERTGSLGTMTSIYFRDPDGSLLEIASYSETETPM